METKVLEKLGLTEGEIRAYLALLRLGQSAAGPIAMESRVSRSKIYLVLDKLEKKGLASHADKRGVRHFQAVEPAKLRDYLAEKEGELRSLEAELERFLPRLEEYHKSAGKSHFVAVYQGFRGLQVAHEHIYLKLKRGDSYFVLGAPGGRVWKDSERFWQKDHARRAESGIGCRILFNADVDKGVLDDRNGKPLCEARYMPVGIVTPAEVEVYKDTTLIITISQEPVAIEIVSQDIANSFKSYFSQFWKKSRPLR